MVIFETVQEVQCPEAFSVLYYQASWWSFPFSTTHITCLLWLKVKELKPSLSLAVGLQKYVSVNIFVNLNCNIICNEDNALCKKQLLHKAVRVFANNNP